MPRFPSLLLASAFLTLTALSLPLHADDGPPPGAPNAADAPTTHPGPPPAGVHFIPPHLMDKLNLTDDQKKQIADLEKETKAKLDKILTPEQKKIVDEARPPRHDGQGPGGKAGGAGGDGPPGRGGDGPGPGGNGGNAPQ